ncbi:MAG: hypothetical protein V3V01_14170 [Acidimicrobiales bacterium]
MQKFIDRTLYAESGGPIGEVRDVIRRPQDLEPEWLVVKTNRIRGEHLVPISAVVEKHQSLTVPFDKETVKASPVVKEHIAPPTSERVATYRHYGLLAPE